MLSDFTSVLGGINTLLNMSLSTVLYCSAGLDRIYCSVLLSAKERFFT